MAKTSDRASRPEAWWDQLLPSQIGGDVIVAKIGANAHGVAVGKNIQQTVDSKLGAMTQEDRQVIEQRLADLDKAVDQARGQLDPATATIADFQKKSLRGELSKTGDGQTPNASTLMTAADWLLDNLPQAAGAIVGLFTTPAVGKVVGKAGDIAVQWAKQRFGHGDAAKTYAS